MKKLFLLCICLLCICCPIYAKEGIYSIDIDVYIDNFGNANITETWLCESYSGTEWYHPYYNLGNAKITNLSVSENGKDYTLISPWDTEKSQLYKTEKCGFNRISNGIEICWGMGAYGKHEYKVNYTITNFVDQLNDCQMIYWTLIPHNRSDRVDNASIKIYTDKCFENSLPVWGFGENGGICKVTDGYIEMKSKNELAISEFMTILVKLPKDFFNTANKTNKDFAYYYNMAIKDTELDKENSNQNVKNNILNSRFLAIAIMASILCAPFFINLLFSSIGNGLVKITTKLPTHFSSLFWITFILLLWIFGIKVCFVLFLIAIIANKKIKEKKVLKEIILESKIEYYRDIPCNKDLFKSYYLAYQYGILKNETDFLGAIILKWIKEKRATIVNKNLDKNNDCILLKIDYRNWSWDNIYEKQLYQMMYEASGDGILEKKELKKWCNNKFSKLFSWFDCVIAYEQSKLIENNEIILEKKSNSTEYVITEKLFNEAKQICGFKKYLKNFSLLHEREAIEVHLFEEYLILAQMLGIAKKVAKQFKKLYPATIESSNFNYNDYIFVNSISHVTIHIAKNAEMRFNLAKSISSGGGGRSFGGGGSGSRGGGGGGGGRR